MSLLKWPLVVAAIAVVLRIVLELSGAPGPLVNAVSVVVLYLLICPIYFAVRIAGSGDAHPYRTHFKTTALYTALCRGMIIPTYWLAYHFQWTAPRFQLDNGGVVGEGSTVFYAFWFPFGAAVIWIVASLVIGGGIGSAIIAVKRRK